MIRIARGTCPDELTDVETPMGDHYNKPGVVHALWDMQHGKCCYCERRLPEKGHLKAVEHFAPKAIFKGRRNDWDNLLLACAQCNGKKSERFAIILSTQENEDKVIYLEKEQGGQPAIINPCQVNPEEHIAYEVVDALSYGEVRAKDNSPLGATTITTVGLLSTFYTNLRHMHATRILVVQMNLLFEAVRGGNKLAIDTARARFESLLSADNEFAGFARAWARYHRVDRPEVGVTIPH